jgi:hypothetical protein
MSVKRNTIHLVPPGAALKEAAARELTTTSEYARRALVERLRHDGVLPVRSATAEHRANAA